MKGGRAEGGNNTALFSIENNSDWTGRSARWFFIYHGIRNPKSTQHYTDISPTFAPPIFPPLCPTSPTLCPSQLIPKGEWLAIHFTAPAYSSTRWPDTRAFPSSEKPLPPTYPVRSHLRQMYAGEGENQCSNGSSDGPFLRRVEKIGKEGNRESRSHPRF